VFIREGDPDSIAVSPGGDVDDSCSDFLASRRDILDDESQFVDVEAGSDIETG
jgi:hypothetical protein